jgi:uncharacterized protein (TIGR02271 family)
VEQRDDRFTAIEDRYADYTVYDRDGDKIGKVNDILVDETDQPEYIGVKMGFLGLSSTLIPLELCRIDERDRRIEISMDKETVKNGPVFDDDEEITPELEERVRSHYGLQATGTGAHSGAYGEYYDNETRTGDRTSVGTAGPGMTMGDRDRGGKFREHAPGEEGVREREDDLNYTDELRVQRSEEEIRAGTREREAGRLNVRKRVRTDREQVRVPTRREEVSVERVPVNEERTGAEIGEDEVSVPVVEEEAVVGKQSVVKEEVRVRKDVVQDEEVVEEDVRKEEVDVDEQMTGRAGRGTDDLEDQARRRDR